MPVSPAVLIAILFALAVAVLLWRQTQPRRLPPPPVDEGTAIEAQAQADPIVEEIAETPIMVAPPAGAMPASLPVDPAPAEVADPSPAPTAEPAAAGLDDRPVTTLKGLGPKVGARLAELGVATIADLAGLDEQGAAALDAQLGTFSGRMARDRWIEQAKLLAAGDIKGFEAAFGKLGG